MKTITLRKLLDFWACKEGIESYCAHLFLTEVKTLEDFAKLQDEVLDAERALVDYLKLDTLYHVIWAIRCLDDWRTVAVEFAQGCADAADDDAARSAAAAAAAAANAAAAASDASWAAAAAWAAARADAAAAGYPDAAAERARQVEHLRELLS